MNSTTDVFLEVFENIQHNYFKEHLWMAASEDKNTCTSRKQTLWDDPFTKDVKFSKKLTYFNHWYTSFAFQGVSNVNFSELFSYVPNG